MAAGDCAVDWDGDAVVADADEEVAAAVAAAVVWGPVA